MAIVKGVWPSFLELKWRRPRGLIPSIENTWNSLPRNLHLCELPITLFFDTGMRKCSLSGSPIFYMTWRGCTWDRVAWIGGKERSWTRQSRNVRFIVTLCNMYLSIWTPHRTYADSGCIQWMGHDGFISNHLMLECIGTTPQQMAQKGLNDGQSFPCKNYLATQKNVPPKSPLRASI